mgnify:FL=1
MLKSFSSCISTPCDSSLSTAFEPISRFPMICKLSSKYGLTPARPAIKVSNTACRSSSSNVLMIRSLCSPFELLSWYRSLYAFSLPFSIYRKTKSSSSLPSMMWFANTQELSLLAIRPVPCFQRHDCLPQLSPSQRFRHYHSSGKKGSAD